MINSVYTNILSDILIPNAAQVQSSLRCLSNIGSNDELNISEAVFAELGSQFLSFSIDLSPPPLVEDPDRFYRSGGK
jgi:hypothetical protein